MANIKNDNFTCIADYYGSNVQSFKVDSFRCFLTYFTVILNKIQFGYICSAFQFLIIFVSIFGGIKENYRWFVVNQAFWDLAISYQFICDNWVPFIFLGIIDSPCFYNFNIGWLKDFFQYSIDTNSYSALMLFSLSRFIGVYFSNFYQKLTSNKRIIFVIFIFNFIVVFTNINSLFYELSEKRNANLVEECLQQAKIKKVSKNSCLDYYENDFQVTLFNILFNVFSCIMFIKPMICLLISFLSALFLIRQVSKQFKFQYKQNKKNLLGSIRICVVITLQTLINLFVFFIECVKNIPLFMSNTVGITILTSKTSWECEECYYFILPSWIAGEFGFVYAPVLQAIVQLRIFLESFLILFLLTGYREGIVRIIKKPLQICKRNNQTHPTITTTPVSAFHSNNNTRTRVSTFHSRIH